MSDKVQLYFYNGMSEPEKIDVNDLTITSNHLGDVTGAFMSEYRETLANYTLSDMVENQPLYEYNVFINPTRKQLQEYNKSVLLDSNQYLDNFVPIN